MAAITHRGVTYTLSAGTPTMNLDLQLQGGVDQDETGWLSGAAAAAGTYPGAITPFIATNMEATADGTTDDLTAMELWLVLG